MSEVTLPDVRRSASGPRIRASRIAAWAGKWLVLAVFFVVTIMPLFWLVFTSLKTNAEFLTDPFALPATLQFENYLKAIQVSGLPRLLLNSVIVSSASTAINMLICSMGGFVFARERFRGRQLILTGILAGVLVPIIAFMVPYYQIIRSIRLYDTLLGLTIVYTAINLPISTFLLHGFMKSIPFEMEEAGIIDGCTFWQRYALIVLPLSKLGIVTAATFVFLFSWNEFVYALLLTASFATRTLQLGIRDFSGQFFTDYTGMFAAITLSILPSVIVYVFFHERIISGLTSGALKS